MQQGRGRWASLLLRGDRPRRRAAAALQARPVLLELVEAAGELSSRAGPHLLLPPLLGRRPRGGRRGQAASGRRGGARRGGQARAVSPEEVRQEEGGRQRARVRKARQGRRGRAHHREGPEEAERRQAAAQSELSLRNGDDGHGAARLGVRPKTGSGRHGEAVAAAAGRFGARTMTRARRRSNK